MRPGTALDLLDAGAGLMPFFTTPMDVIAAGAGYGTPVKDSRILRNGKEHRVALLWFNGHQPTLTGFHRDDRKLKYMFVEQRIYKGPNRGRTVVNAIVPVVHWRQFKRRAVPRVMMWTTSEGILRKLKKFGMPIEFTVQNVRKDGRPVYRETEDRMLPYVVTLYGRRLFDDAADLLQGIKSDSRTKRWGIQEM